MWNFIVEHWFISGLIYLVVSFAICVFIGKFIAVGNGKPHA